MFFALMAFLSVRNAGAVDGPYVSLALATVSFFYAFSGLADGQYTHRGHVIASLPQDPWGFWIIFFAAASFGAGALVYAYTQGKPRKRPAPIVAP